MADELDTKRIDVLVANFEDIVILADKTLALNGQDPEWQRFATEMKSIYQTDIQQLKSWRANWFPKASLSANQPRGEFFFDASINESGTVNRGLIKTWDSLVNELLEYTRLTERDTKKTDLKLYISTLTQRLEATSQRLERLYTLSDSVLYP